MCVLVGMDPLSIIVSSITIIQTAGIIIKALKALAPSDREIEKTITEIQVFVAVIEHTKSTVGHGNLQTTLDQRRTVHHLLAIADQRICELARLIGAELNITNSIVEFNHSVSRRR